jgi:hypothetical protein
MVTPPALIAAIPVGATITAFLYVFLMMYFKKVVLPVPALPVRKIFLLVLLMNLEAMDAVFSVVVRDMI